MKTHGKNRQGEAGNIPARQQRFYAIGQEWFFHTREGIAQGPFKNLISAKAELKLFLRRCGIVRFAS